MLSMHRSKRASLTGNWDNLKEVKACFICSAKFGVTRRKYHCRVCGHITCASCSKTRVHLPTSRSGQAKRVCDSCVPGVRAGLKSGEVMKEASDVDDDIGLVDSEEEHKVNAAGGGLIASNRMAHDHAAAAAAAAAAVQATNARAPTDRKVHLLTAEEEAEIVNDSLAEAGF